jgi:Glycosyl hydrolase family 76
MKRLLLTTLAAASLCAVSAAQAQTAPSPLTATQVTYRALADRGVNKARRLWGSHQLHWYRDRLHVHRKYPLATIWSVVPLWETMNALAIADHSRAHVAAVNGFAKGAERYYNRAMHGYGPYPGGRDRETVWFDDNGWWGIAFVDAWRATGNRRYLRDADFALRFVARYGWASNGGLWWNTRHAHKAGEALAANALLGALLYQATHNGRYLALVDRWIGWGDQHMAGRRGMYGIRVGDRSPVSYVQGPMIEAHRVLCDVTGEANRCARAQQLANEAYRSFGQQLNMGPQFDTVYLRSMLELYARDHDRRWYDLAVANAERARQNSRSGGDLYLRAWDGGPITRHDAKPHMLQTQAATIELFAWLAATPPPNP